MFARTAISSRTLNLNLLGLAASGGTSAAPQMPSRFQLLRRGVMPSPLRGSR